MNKLINQVKQAVNYWDEKKLTERFNKAVELYERGFFTPVDFARVLIEIYDDCTIPKF